MLPHHLFYGFLYIADKYEGLVIVGDPNLKPKLRELALSSMATQPITSCKGRWHSIPMER